MLGADFNSSGMYRRSLHHMYDYTKYQVRKVKILCICVRTMLASRQVCHSPTKFSTD